MIGYERKGQNLVQPMEDNRFPRIYYTYSHRRKKEKRKTKE
jgi:hypothetical protein